MGLSGYGKVKNWWDQEMGESRNMHFMEYASIM